jgi:hypothetical protein
MKFIYPGAIVFEVKYREGEEMGNCSDCDAVNEELCALSSLTSLTFTVGFQDWVKVT